MKYIEFRDRIQQTLLDHPDGLTWKQLREQCDLPYDRPCSEWTNRLVQEIGLSRVKDISRGRALIWKGSS